MKHITDMGEPLVLTRERDGGEPETFNVGRYGVWCDGNVIDTGDDLPALQQKHGPGLPVRRLRAGAVPVEAVSATTPSWWTSTRFARATPRPRSTGCGATG